MNITKNINNIKLWKFRPRYCHIILHLLQLACPLHTISLRNHYLHLRGNLYPLCCVYGGTATLTRCFNQFLLYHSINDIWFHGVSLMQWVSWSLAVQTYSMGVMINWLYKLNYKLKITCSTCKMAERDIRKL